MLLLDLLKDFYPQPVPLVDISGLTLDTRLLSPGDLFIAKSGTHQDGRQFIEEAIQKGAAAILQEGKQSAITLEPIPIISLPNLSSQVGKIAACFYDHPALQMPVVGITGTSGKTSCSHFIAASLQKLAIPCGVIGTLGNGLYGSLQESNLTTPDAITLQKTLAELHQQGAKAVAMEVSSHSLDQHRVSGIFFKIGIFTNLSRDHLDYHGTMEKYGAAKRKLFDQAHFAVINADDDFGASILSTCKNAISFGIKNKKLDVLAENIQLNDQGIYASIKTPWGDGDVYAPLMGAFNISNVLAALSALCLMEIPLSKALECIANLPTVPGRMQMFGGKNTPLVVVDYAHKPDALEKVLIALRAHTQGKLFCIFGCGGERDRGKRPLMAKIAEKLADQVIVTDDNPRHEDSKKIAADILMGFSQPNRVTVQHDRSKAIQNVIQCAASGDVVLIAGKGAETYQIVGTDKVPFSDIEVVLHSL